MNEAAREWVNPVFPEEEIPHILAALLRCLKLLRKTGHQELETSLTKRLHKLLKQDQHLRDRPVWPERETVEDEEETEEEGRLDIRFQLLDPMQKPPPYFAVEAKRLHVRFKSGRKSLVAEYVTHRQGMMCFIEGRYSNRLRSGGMLGYVFDGDIAQAAASITGHLGAHSEKLKLAPPHSLKPHSQNPPEPVWTTIHQIGGQPFTLFHILVAV